MLIKNLKNRIFNVGFEELYIKPFYSLEKIDCYAICVNKKNFEEVIVIYKDKTITKHMLHLLSLYQDYNLETIILTEVQLAQDLLLQSKMRLEKAQEEEENESNKTRHYKK
ncbi:hypothetical protein [Clostridium rectalis]|uniref:hypothetical protein n=1 Tax=Clostridium rectalis TaxID=2040295 RepID=UPI000F63DE3E|nr:hypothetical protein [Clostridium rectalis]